LDPLDSVAQLVDVTLKFISFAFDFLRLIKLFVLFSQEAVVDDDPAIGCNGGALELDASSS